ncbi:uncharacterized protein EV422DRAFT_523540 [Fimicolochytrium jonesii]|uniref:uncharacterized protein n=1 Tax=Fimicolochytrium jonesii TaxID=1396493 RepID=UPI0022FF355D|nr:uncharacterized protein EV422DRAFT_523540 [Fimicolochytrium jonesii]KAI8823147.1 hypothetical protein EV422DRAFT_523540 [Fimicolochytrium jonesii]
MVSATPTNWKYELLAKYARSGSTQGSTPPQPQLNAPTAAAPTPPQGIPRFFRKRKKHTSALAKDLARAAYLRFIERQRERLPTNEEIDELWDRLVERADGKGDDNEDVGDFEKRISYRGFVALKQVMPVTLHPYFQPSIFLALLQGVGDDTIAIVQFFNLVVRQVSLLQARTDLSVYDTDHDGYLTEPDIQGYIADLMPSLHLDIPPTFFKMYCVTASRKFMFFLDPKRRGKVKIQTLLLSPILTELFELRDPELSEEFKRTNWFSGLSALRVYGQFLNLNPTNDPTRPEFKDKGLDRVQMSKYKGGSLTPVFLDRVFQETPLLKGRMTYPHFLDFALATENAHTPESIAYCFKFLDLRGEGWIDGPAVMYFFNAVVERMMAGGHDPIGIRDVKNEIFDMVNPSDPRRITLDDLLACGVGGTVVKMLSDIEGFLAYETRENVDPGMLAPAL